MPFIGFWSADKAPVGGEIASTSPYTPTSAFEMRKYIHITLKNRIRTYDKLGNGFTTEHLYKIKPCSDENF